MPGWMRVIRGMVGTGMAFTVGGGAVASLVGVPMWLAGRIGFLDLLFVAARFGVVSFLIGVAFSGLLALTARGLTLEKLSLKKVTTLGAGVGLAWFAFIAQNGIGVWSTGVLLLNLGMLVAIGGGSAAATLLLARRARTALADGDEPPELDAAEAQLPLGAGLPLERLTSRAAREGVR